jgi:hypothetical protein
MPTLGELLVADGVCTPQQIEDAVQNQVILGGRLGTNLIELGALSEEVLARYLSRLHERPALSGEAIHPESEALQMISGPVADRLQIIPFLRENKKLQVLCVDPRNVAALDEVAFITNLVPDPVVIPEVRFWHLLERCYRIQRQLRYIALEGGDFMRRSLVEERAPTVPPVGEDLISEDSFNRLYQRRDGFPQVSTRSPALPSENMPLLRPEDLEEIAEPTLPGPPGQIDRRVWQGPLSSEGRRKEDRDLAERAAARPSTPPLPADSEPPLDFAEATRLLRQVQGRDSIARVVLRHARSRFKRAMLFTIHRGFALGWNAAGDVDPATFRSLMVPLDEPSAFGLAVSSRSHVLGALTKTRVNVNFLRLMGKQVPLSAFLLPILVRGRVVNLLYGDNGHRNHCESDIGELLILAQHMAQSYESLFNEKREAYRSRQRPDG